MALTRPKLSHNIDTDSSVFTDPILVLHQSATAANVDSGFLFNRANGLVSNVAIYWSESANSFVTAFTTNAGSSNSNISVSTYANLITGILTSNSISNSGTLVIGNTGDVSANIGSFYTYANATFATVSGTSSGIDANLGAFQAYANTKIGTTVVSIFSCAIENVATKNETLPKIIFLNISLKLCARQGLQCTLFIFSLAALPAQVPLVLKQEGSNLSHFFSNGTPMRTEQI
jgi:hypothetical protein